MDDDDELTPHQRASALAAARRRIDILTDQRFRRLETKVDEIDRKVDALSNRLAWLAGGLAVLSIIANIVGPTLAKALLGVI